MRKLRILTWVLLVLLLGACRAPQASAAKATPRPTSAAAVPATLLADDPFFAAVGSGEPRSAGYWLLWNGCAEGNKAEVAAANGGREAGWIIMDDLLADPGVLVGEMQVLTCGEGVRLLQGQPMQQGAVDAPAYPLASQLLTAQLNLAAGAEYCPAVNDAVQSAQLLLLSAGFDGSEAALGPDAAAEEREMAGFLGEQLAQYNAGDLCR